MENRKDTPVKASLIIKNALLLTMDNDRRVIENGTLAVSNGEILELGSSAVITKRYLAEQVIDADNCIVIPGLINAHTHIPMSYFKGLADDLPLAKWLQGYIWPLERKLVKSRFVYDSTLHGAAEMLKNGITLTNDMYFHGNDIAEALSKAGLRGIVGEAIVDFRIEELGGLSSIGNYALEQNRIYKDNPLIDFALTPHSIYGCSRPVLEKCAEAALENNLPVHTHLSETEQEVLDCIREHGSTPVRYLQKLGLLKSRMMLAHGIWIKEEEMELLADSDASVAICTESNLKLANGFAPIKKFLEHGVRCCFGTDGVASNNNLDLLTELDFTAKIHKNINSDPTFLPAEQILAMATIGAAQAVGKGASLGSLEVGKKADLVILDCNSIEAQPLFNPYSQVIYSLGGRAVRDVVVNGETVLKNKKLTRLEEAELTEKAKEYKSLILKELAS